MCTDAEEARGQPGMRWFTDEHAALWVCMWPKAISYFSSPLLPSLSSSTHQKWGCPLYWVQEGLLLPHGQPPEKKSITFLLHWTNHNPTFLGPKTVKCHFGNFVFTFSAALCWVVTANVKLVLVQNLHNCKWNIKYYIILYYSNNTIMNSLNLLNGLNPKKIKSITVSTKY